MYGQHCPRNSYSHYPRRSEEARNPIESVILLGQRPGAWDDPKGSAQVSGGLANYDTRCVLYDEPLHTGQLARAEPTLRLWRKAGAKTPVPGTARRIRAVIQYLGLHAALRAAGGRQTS